MTGPSQWFNRLHLTIRRKIRFRLAHKVTALMVLLILLVSSIANYVIYTYGIGAIHEATREKLMMYAADAAAAIDSDKLLSIQSRRDEKGKVYRQLQTILQSMQKASQGKLRYVYILSERNGRYVFVVDAVPIDQPDHSSVGADFDVRTFPYAIKGFKEITAEKRVNYDKEFKVYSQSGYAPIRNHNGKTIGVIGVDMDVTALQSEERRMRNAAHTALIIAAFLALVSGIAFSTYLTNPIEVLSYSTRRIARGDLDTVVTINRRDEIGELAEAFNSMTQDLKRSHESLQRYSIELEEKVGKRTAELTQINKEMKDILDHIGQALFTIDRDLRFNPQHSKFAHQLFGDEPFAGRSLLDLLFDSADSTEREDLSSWLQMVYNQTFLHWEDLEEIQPIKTMPIRRKFSDGRERTKFIDISFRPIFEYPIAEAPSKVTKIMVLIHDITDKKQLEEKMMQQEQTYKENINQIVEIIKADQDLFREFISESQEQLVLIEPKLIALKDEPGNSELVNDLFRIMHTIKGNAKVFKLERVAAEAHAIEEILSAIRNGDRFMNDDLLDECFAKIDRFTSLFNETIEIYKRIISGKSLDMGKTRTEKRISEDSKIVKVKVEDIHHLGQLVKKMDFILLDQSDESLNAALDKDKFDSIQNLLKETEQQLRDLKKVPVGQIFPRFPRMVRDISMELGKSVNLMTTGEEYLVDKYVFEHIGDPMIHLIRNALDHGIETPEERLAVGKPAEGTIHLDVKVNENMLYIVVTDDGRGLDIVRIKEKALEIGIITPKESEAILDDDAVRLIFTPGFSTSRKVSSISGRGVGMDVVKTYIENKLGGTVILENRKNEGLAVTLKVPLGQDQD